jgi:hypothetical protein
MKQTFNIPVTELAYSGTTAKSNHVLVQPTGKRFGIGGVPRGQSGRKVFQGPLVEGPWAFAFGLCSVIAANPERGTWGEIRRNKEAGIEHDVHEGDELVFDGVRYRIEFTDGFGMKTGNQRRDEFIQLVKIGEVK